MVWRPDNEQWRCGVTTEIVVACGDEKEKPQGYMSGMYKSMSGVVEYVDI